jgi:BTB/POZ domain
LRRSKIASTSRFQRSFPYSSASFAVVKPPTSLSRHGPGDGVVKLNVGGKEFLTLRSTIQSNAVLADYVARAEANCEFNGGAVFIDRDPTHFGVILTFLRNKTEGIAYNSRFSAKDCHKTLAHKPKYVRLPNDQGVLQDLYVEACHYKIFDLQKQLCEASIVTSVFSYFGGGGNPYQQASDFFKRLRTWSAVAFVGTTGGIMANLQADLDNMLGDRSFKLPTLSDGEKVKKSQTPSAV